MVAADRGQTSTGKASGSGCKSGLTRYLGECNVCKDNAAKVETKEIKDEAAIGKRGIDDIGGHAKPDQYGRSICGLGHGSARAFSRQAFLRRAHVRVLGVMEYLEAASRCRSAQLAAKDPTRAKNPPAHRSLDLPGLASKVLNVARGEARSAYKRAFDAQLAVYTGKPPTG
jgi:hypothetical protein